MASYIEIISRRETSPPINVDYPRGDFIINTTSGWSDNSTTDRIVHRSGFSSGNYVYSIKLANNNITGFKMLLNDASNADITYKFTESGNISNIENGVLTLSGNDAALKIFADFITASVYARCLLVLMTGAEPNYYDLVQNLTNCSSNISGSTIIEFQGKEIILTCITGFIFEEVPTITIGGNTLNFNLNSDSTVATITIDVVDNIVINAVGMRDMRVYITGVIENATCNYEDGELVNLSKPIIISANSGYTFKDSYALKWNNTVQTFTNETTRLVYNLSEYTTNHTYLNGNYIATKEIEQVGTFVNLYNVNQSELTDLSKKRLITNADGQITDYGQFINSLYILPFNIPIDMVGDRANIILGNLDSKVESTLINTYMFEFVGGEIEVPLKYNNIYDFVNTECILHLPFLNKMYLNTEYVIGQTITLDFTVDLYSGSLTINVTSSFNNEIIASVKGLIGMNIPFIQKSNNSVINSVSNIYKNNIDRCFIEVNRNIPYTKNSNIFGGSVVEYGKIGDYIGYLECDNIVLETKATNQEQEEIKNILRNGIVIRDKEPDVYLAQDSDFVNINGRWVYRGAELEVEIPTHINGQVVTSTSYMFGGSSTYEATPVTKVVLRHFNVTDMRYMFQSSLATTLDLSSFDTSNVTNMSAMFRDSSATSLDLSGFNTSNVTDMYAMFYTSSATSLDLSSFDTSNVTSMASMFHTSSATSLDLSGFNTSNVTDMRSMFYNSSATTGYARTQVDADKFNASSGKPAGLNFVVK